MRKVAIQGIGQTVISEHWDISLNDLATKAIFAALRDARRVSEWHRTLEAVEPML